MVVIPTPRVVQRTYLLLLLGNTLAASLIWGINTIFLLDAGLSNLEAFAANASFTAGMVLFGVPTGIVASGLMRDIGFTPEKSGSPLAELRKLAGASIEYGWRVPAVKWLMVQSLFTGGVGIYAFYALQPYLLDLYGNPHAYQVAGLVAA